MQTVPRDNLIKTVETIEFFAKHTFREYDLLADLAVKELLLEPATVIYKLS